MNKKRYKEVIKEREIVGYREIGDKVQPAYMTDKEYISYLCHQYGFRISSGWDGVERRHYRANYSPDLTHNVQNRDEALNFLGITKNPKAPNGIEQRAGDRRVSRKKYPKAQNRRKYIRRKEEAIARKKDAILYYSVVALGFLTLFIIYSAMAMEVIK